MKIQFDELATIPINTDFYEPMYITLPNTYTTKSKKEEIKKTKHNRGFGKAQGRWIDLTWIRYLFFNLIC